MTIQEQLTNWKFNSLFGERNFEKQTFTLVEGQELYLISMRYIISIGGVKKQIETHKFFQTNFQGVSNKCEVNPKADEYICKNILLQLESDFFKEFNAIFDEGARNLSDSF